MKNKTIIFKHFIIVKGLNTPTENTLSREQISLHLHRQRDIKDYI